MELSSWFSSHERADAFADLGCLDVDFLAIGSLKTSQRVIHLGFLQHFVDILEAPAQSFLRIVNFLNRRPKQLGKVSRFE